MIDFTKNIGYKPMNTPTIISIIFAVLALDLKVIDIATNANCVCKREKKGFFFKEKNKIGGQTE